MHREHCYLIWELAPLHRTNKNIYIYLLLFLNKISFQRKMANLDEILKSRDHTRSGGIGPKPRNLSLFDVADYFVRLYLDRLVGDVKDVLVFDH